MKLDKVRQPDGWLWEGRRVMKLYKVRQPDGSYFVVKCPDGLDPKDATAVAMNPLDAKPWEGADLNNLALRDQHRANTLADEAQALRDENTALLAENARLRRALERKR